MEQNEVMHEDEQQLVEPQRDEQQQETEHLKHQLHMRDQLVEQLSSQLFQMVQEHPPALPQARSSLAIGSSTAPPADQQGLEQQLSFYQDQLDQRDQQIEQLKATCQDLSDRNKVLENVVQDLPEVYRQQFSEKLQQFRDKFHSLKIENLRLKAALGQPNSNRNRHRKLFLPHRK